MIDNLSTARRIVDAYQAKASGGYRDVRELDGARDLLRNVENRDEARQEIKRINYLKSRTPRS